MRILAYAIQEVGQLATVGGISEKGVKEKEMSRGLYGPPTIPTKKFCSKCGGRLLQREDIRLRGYNPYNGKPVKERLWMCENTGKDRAPMDDGDLMFEITITTLHSMEWRGV